MRFFFKMIVLLGGLFFSSLIWAGNSPVGRSGMVDTQGLPYVHIADYYSNPGESKNDFLLRIGPKLRAYSDKTGFEACGVIATNQQGQFAVVLGSSLSHIGCVNDTTRIPHGMTSTNETIHSHGRNGLRIMATQSDWILMGNPFNPPHYVGGFDLSHFSDQDFEHPGYLATPTGVLYQDGSASSVQQLKP